VAQFEQGTVGERVACLGEGFGEAATDCVDVDASARKLARDDNGEFFRRISSLELRTTLLRV